MIVSCSKCGRDCDATVTMIDGECYSCAKSGISFGSMPQGVFGGSVRAEMDAHKSWDANIGEDTIKGDKGEIISQFKKDAETGNSQGALGTGNIFQEGGVSSQIGFD